MFSNPTSFDDYHISTCIFYVIPSYFSIFVNFCLQKFNPKRPNACDHKHRYALRWVLYLKEKEKKKNYVILVNVFIYGQHKSIMCALGRINDTEGGRDRTRVERRAHRIATRYDEDKPKVAGRALFRIIPNRRD